jgi:hypothetical protein
MTKKVWAGLSALVLIFAVGTSAYAIGSDWSFDKMLPYMKQMHPNFTDEQFETMYRSCHGENGTMRNIDPSYKRNMMN